MLRWTTLAICALFFGCGDQTNVTCTKGDRCVHYLSGLPGTGTGGNGGGGGTGGGADMAHASSADMAHASSTDMAQSSSTDMAMASSTDMAMACVGPGGDCTFHNDAVCCSNYCIYSTNKCR